MCGIVGYMGQSEAQEILLKALKRLEYRGYDSAGIALVKDSIRIFKNKGRIKDLEKPLDRAHETAGIGHTRWATHGAPSKLNSHPHTDCQGDIAVVHNGILENFHTLKMEIKEKGHNVISDTDSELVAHLFEDAYAGDLKKAMVKTVSKLRGSFALAVLHKDHPGEIVAYRYQSPLVVGVGQGENMVASDVPAILGHTNKVIYLDEGNGAVLRSDNVDLFDNEGRPIDIDPQEILWTLEDAEKGGYEHFMLKEIFEQPKALRESMLGKISSSGDVFVSPLLKEKYSKIKNIKIVACGTSFHAGLVGRYAITHLTGLPCQVEIGSEYRYLDPTSDEQVIIFISQSGETADTLAAAKEAVSRGLITIGVTNVLGSSITRVVDETIYTNAGPEIGVAASKSFITQLLIMYLISIQLGVSRGTLPPERARQLNQQLRKMPRNIEIVLNDTSLIQAVAKELSTASSIFFIGRNINYPTALEGALKLKEISYIHAEGYPAGELKHGPIALLDDKTPVIALAPKDFIYDKMASNIGEVLSRDAPVIGILSEDDTEMEKYVDHVLCIPRVDELLTPIPITVVEQLLSYYCALELGCSIDKPKNLAKSVTVE